MADISAWSANEKENTHLDELTLSGESGQYINKIMCAVKAKSDEIDGKLAKVQGAYVFKGVKATYAELPATGQEVGDVWSVTELGGENYAWDGTAWDALGTSDANVVHKNDNETISGTKTFSSAILLSYNAMRRSQGSSSIRIFGGGSTSFANGAGIELAATEKSTGGGVFTLSTGGESAPALVGQPDGTLTWDGQEIQTASDERLKTHLAPVSDEVLDAWGDVCWGQFQFLSAIDCKGKTARLHLGLIAQRVKDAFEAKGLDACDYGILCHEVREASEDRPAKDIWMVRYAEALAMEAAFQRRRADSMVRRIEALEAKVDGIN